MNDSVTMEMCQTAENLTTDVRNPLNTQRVAADRLYQFRYRPSATELHHQPQLVIFPVNALADKCAIVCGDVPMMRVLQIDSTRSLFTMSMASWIK